MDGGLQRASSAAGGKRMLDDLTDHFIVCGYGRIGAIIVEELRRQHVPYVVIERDHERVQAVMEAGGLAVEADASSEDVLTRLGIARARGLIAAVGTDAENVYAVLTARVLRPDLYIVGRAETEDAERKLLRAGANRVVSPYRIGARELAQTALRPAVVDFFQLATRSGNLELAIEQVAIGAGSPLGGPVDHRRQRPAALRPDRRRHPARRPARWSSTRPAMPSCTPATSWWCWAAPTALRDLEAAAAQATA